MTDMPLETNHAPKAYSNRQVWVRRFSVLFLLTVLLTGGYFSVVQAAPLPQTATPTAPNHIVISEFRTNGPGASPGNDEFIELFNPTDSAVNIGGLKIMVLTGTGTTSLRATLPAVLLFPGNHYLIANSTGYSGSVSPDFPYSTGIVDGGGIALTQSDGTTIIDQVGLSAVSLYGEGTHLSALLGNLNQSYERKLGNIDGSCYDTNDNSVDFQVITTSAPENSSSAPTYCAGVLTVTPTTTLTATNSATASSTRTVTNTATTTFTPTISPTVTRSLTPSSTATITNTPLPGGTSTPTRTRTLTPTFTLTTTSTATYAPPSILINEVAWSGTIASRFDEWIELYNPSTTVVDLNGWTLSDPISGFSITLTGQISGRGFYLLERTDDTAIIDVDANLTYTGEIKDSGDFLILTDQNNNRIDTANFNQGAWPAGSGAPNRCSMERNSATADDNDFGWFTNDGSVRFAHDVASNSICGSPKQPNWAYNVTATPLPSATISRTPTRTKGPSETRTPTSSRTLTPSMTPTITLTPTITETPTKTRTPSLTRTPSKTNTHTPAPLPVSSIVINEFLVRPRFDWNGDGKINWGDAFIEIKNLSTESKSVSGWYLDDQIGDSSPYYLPGDTLEPGGRAVYYASDSKLVLSDYSDSVRLFSPSAISDVYTYQGVKLSNISWCRLPDGADLVHNAWNFGCEPTPKTENKLAQVIPVTNNDSELAMCLSDDTLTVVYDAECMANGLAVWSPLYWSDPLQKEYPLYIKRDDFTDILE